jgi:hypothetical protein
LKFKVSKKVKSFKVNRVRYFPGDIVELPETYLKPCSRFLEPIKETPEVVPESFEGKSDEKAEAELETEGHKAEMADSIEALDKPPTPKTKRLIKPLA